MEWGINTHGSMHLSLFRKGEVCLLGFGRQDVGTYLRQKEGSEWRIHIHGHSTNGKVHIQYQKLLLEFGQKKKKEGYC